jgi:hypothetical protein
MVGLRKQPSSSLNAADKSGILETDLAAREAAECDACSPSNSNACSPSTHSGSDGCSELIQEHGKREEASAFAVVFPSKPAVAFGLAPRWPSPDNQELHTGGTPCAFAASEATAEGVCVLLHFALHDCWRGGALLGGACVSFLCPKAS